MSDQEFTEPREAADEPTAELENTAAGWRSNVDDPQAAESVDEVARGAERAAEQPGYGREGS